MKDINITQEKAKRFLKKNLLKNSFLSEKDINMDYTHIINLYTDLLNKYDLDKKQLYKKLDLNEIDLNEFVRKIKFINGSIIRVEILKNSLYEEENKKGENK